MRRSITLIILIFYGVPNYAQQRLSFKPYNNMKLNAGIITDKLTESKKFYTEILNFGVRFENEFYLLLHTPDGQSEISFLLPDHPSQQGLFHKPFQGQGVYLTIETENVDELYHSLKKKNVPLKIELRNEPWGDRHFAIEDPNGVAIDLVQYTKPDQ